MVTDECFERCECFEIRQAKAPTEVSVCEASAKRSFEPDASVLSVIALNASSERMFGAELAMPPRSWLAYTLSWTPLT